LQSLETVDLSRVRGSESVAVKLRASGRDWTIKTVKPVDIGADSQK